ncbi:MAG: hypothetical protein R3F60_10735 [bacterium]
MIRRGLVAALLLCAAPPVPAAEVADVIDAADGVDLFDFVGEIRYRRTLRRAKITREYGCDPNQATNPSRFMGDQETCGDAGPAGRLLQVKEVRYERITHEIEPRFRFGLWHDLELSISAPVVLEDSQHIRFAGNGGDPDKEPITPENSTIAPADGVQLFPVPTDGLPTRAGFGDMTFMVRYAPVSRDRDETRGEWALELGWQVPTGEVMKLGNEGVGRGLHTLIIGQAFSYRTPYADPYARIGARFPFAAKGSLFRDYGDAQEFVGPGSRVDFDLGAEIIPWTDPARGMKFFIDLGLGAAYQAEGRDYSELFDALALGAELCTPDPAEAGGGNCGRYNPGSRSGVRGEAHDGITTVEQFAQVRGKLDIGAYFSEHARVTAHLSLAHDTEHFISKANIGKDTDGSGRVEDPTSPRYNPAEHNPTFVPAIDTVGQRLRVDETTVFSAGVSVGALF